MNSDSQRQINQTVNYSSLANPSLKSRLYKSLATEPIRGRFELFEKSHIMQATSLVSPQNQRQMLVPKVTLRSRLDPLSNVHEYKQSNLGVTINQGKINFDQDRINQFKSQGNLQDILDSNTYRSNLSKYKNLAPLASKHQSVSNLFNEESIMRGGNETLIDESIVGMFGERQLGAYSLKKQIKERNNAKKQKRKGQIGRSDLTDRQRKQLEAGQKDYLTPMDFIHLIRTDPEMVDEFCYLNKCGNPYEFKIIEFDERNPSEYMTISARGITHFLDDDATFLTIEEWERESRLFYRLKDIEFFLKYKLWKNFFLWKRLMRRNQMIKNQTQMNQQLFTVDRQLRMTLLDVRRMCLNMETDIRFIDSKQETLSHEEFRVAQETYRTNFLESKFNAYEKQIKDTLVSCCQKSLYTFKEENRIPITDENNEEFADRAPLLVGDESGKQMPYTQEATVRTHFKRLKKFVKLIDFVIVDAKLSLINKSTESLVDQIRQLNEDYVQNSSSKKQYQMNSGSSSWILIEAIYRGESIIFSPTRELLSKQFEDIINKSISRIASKHKEMSQASELLQFIQSENEEQVELLETTDLKQLIQANKDFLIMEQNLKIEVNTTFTCVEQYAQILTPFIEWYNVNSSVNVAQNFDGKDIEEFRAAVAMYKEQNNLFQAIEPTAEISIVMFDALKLKERIKNSAAICSAELYSFMPEYNFMRASDLVTKAMSLHSLVAVLPGSVEKFVEYMENITLVSSHIDGLGTCSSEITAMSLLLEELKIKIPERQRSKYQDVGIHVVALRKKVDDAMANYDQNQGRFRKELEKLVPQVDTRVKELQEALSLMPVGDINADIKQLDGLIVEQRKQLNLLKEHSKKLNSFQLALQMEYTQFELLDEFEAEFGLVEKLWKGRMEWADSSVVWLKKQFQTIDIEHMSSVIERLQKTANLCAKDLDRNEVAKVFKADVEAFRNVISVLASLRDPALKEKEWTDIRLLIADLDLDEDTFEDLNNPEYTVLWVQENRLVEIKDKLGEIALQAAKEVELVKMIDNVEGVWRVANIVVANYKDNKEVQILGNNEDVISKIDDTLLTVNNILASRFVEGIRPRVEGQLKLLRYFQELLDEWMLHQRNWLYLEPILNSPYSAKNLVKETKIFQQADVQWKKLMRKARDNPNAKYWAADFSNRSMLHMLHNNNNNFELIQKALDDFLEKKRDIFQRFFFLSNDELLEILSCAKTLETLQPFLRKCFDNIVRLQFDKMDNPIGMISAEGEIVPLRNFAARGSEVEEWLKLLEDQMKYSLKVYMRQALIKYEQENTQRKDWVLEYPLQVVISLDSVFWTKITEENYLSVDAEGDLDDWYEANIGLLDELTILIRGDLTELQRRTLVALVTQDVHFRDIIDNMRVDQVEGIMDFKWQQQLRFYYEDEYIHAKQVNAKLMYGYEYLGSMTRLVITPLTDRCWMTITGALGIQLGAAPQGPAGTGKTESCKDLAKALGRFCIVFNCSDQITAKMMEKQFAGLAYCGAWICLDEFNRIYIEVLSVIAQQVQTIREALLEQRPVFQFFGKNVTLNPNLGIFITMNPGYAGRTELPDNLKVLFRPVAMMVPDYRLIAEIMLFAEGFSEARDLSRKMTKLYKLSSEQLSQQDHYDFGMRAVKSLLVMAGSLKRADPHLPEDVILVRAMREANVPKFLSQDIPLFNAIVTDLFPGLFIPESEQTELVDTIKLQIAGRNLQALDTFVAKVTQLHETLKVRFGVMLVGSTFGGKSECLNILRETYISLAKIYVNQGNKTHPVYQNVDYQVLNPKAISMDELYGMFDVLSQQWTDGLASNIMRAYSALDTFDKKWVVFDGPVDALWIENMNTVLDDSMTLCLSNGERVKLKPQMRMLFEVLDLSVASPATVSRCGMVYLDDKVVGYSAIVSKECAQITKILSTDLIVYLEFQINLAFQKCMPLIQKKAKQLIPVGETQLAVSVIRIIKMTIISYSQQLKLNSLEELNKKHLEKIFLWAFSWAVGATITSETIDVFERVISESFPIDILPRGSVLDYLIKITKIDGVVNVDYQNFTELVPEFEYTRGMSFFEMVVQTKETISYGWFLEQCVMFGGFPLLITGQTGTGKTTMANSALSRLQNSGAVSLLQMTLSAKTSAAVTQLSIEQKLQTNRKNKRTILMPPPGKIMVVFVDDTNMPSTEVYGAQPPIELLRQFIDYKGIYDRKTFFWKDIESTSLICACGPPGGGRSNLTPRFTRHFTLMSLPNSSEATLSSIFTTIATNFLKHNNFKTELVLLAESGALVNATLAIYNEIQKSLLPTPDRSHYVFNLRDVSRVFQGILLARSTVHNRPEQLARLWAHESCRVFMDRLINQKDQDWFKAELVKNMYLFFKLEYKVEDLFESRPPLLFADFLKRGVELNDRIYNEVEDYNLLLKVITDYMNEETKLNLVLFKDAVEHLSRMARVIRQQRGHYMLVGVGGSGKKSLTTLAAVLSGAVSDTIESKKNYGRKEFKEDLFRMMCKVAIDNKIVAFSFSDTQMTQEGFLEDVNNLLNSGEVPNMLTKEDIDIINSGLATEAREKKVTDIYAYFVQKVRSNFHVVLAVSPVGGLLRVRLRMFPSLVNCCTIEWLQKWPEEALLSVASMFLENMEFEGLNQEVRMNLYKMCVNVHQSVEEMCPIFFNTLRRNVYVTPKSYLDLIESYKDLLITRKEEMTSQKSKLSSGLSKLAEANSIISDLKAKLTDLQPILKIKTAETDSLIQKLEVDSLAANNVKAVVQEEERQVNEKAQTIRETKAEADKILNDALPVLQGAQEALNTLNRGDIGEIKQNNNPSQVVRFTLECVAVLLEEKQDWDSIKKNILSDANFLSRMKNLNVYSIPLKTCQKIQAKIASNPSFTPLEVQKISFACKSMCEWVRAVSEFTDVNREIEKKKSQVESLNSELANANSILKVKQDQLGSVIKKVNDLEALYTENKQEKDRLDKEIQTTEGRLIRAEELTVGLADEQERWKETVLTLGIEIKLLLGNVFLAGATISYLGPFSGAFRNEMVDQWLEQMKSYELPHSEQYSFVKVVGEPIQIQNWAAKGLPGDSVSVSNAIIQQFCRSYPMFIDPQSQANRWIKKLYLDSGIKVIKVTQDGLLKNVENAIRQGFPLLIEDMGDTLEATLEPLLLKQYTVVNRRRMIRLGDTELEIDPKFKLFFSTKLSNPHFLPDVFIRVTVINFTVTEQGLEEQLLADVVSIEMPDVETMKQDLIQQISRGKANLKRNEEKILELLASSKGMILDNIDLIENLKLSKIDATTVKKSLIEAEEMQAETELARSQYRPVAIRGSTLYFVISDFTLVDPMYQFSMGYFKRLYGSVIQGTAKSTFIDLRIDSLLNAITETVYSNVCRGLFNAHKRIFSFLMTAKIQLKSGDITQAEWSQFVRGAPIPKIQVQVPKECKLTEKQWNEITHMSLTHPTFKELKASFQFNFKVWELVLYSENPWLSHLPESHEQISAFQRLLLVRVLREEETLYSMTYYVDAILGKKFTSSTPATIDEVFNDTDCKTPLVFILSSGADPLAGLLRFAGVRKVPAEKLAVISLGQGQGIVAEKAIDSAIKSGGWVILQNCHLGKSFMPQLEKRVESLEDPELQGSFNPNFRLILTSMPCDYFPVSVLQNGVKLTIEPPKGLKSNMYKSYSEMPSDYFEGCEKPTQWKKLLFSLAFFHAIVQERRKFGALGWNIRYEFNDSDFETSYTLLRNFLDLPQDVPWDAIIYVVGEISYGGRVTDDWDRRLLLTILGKYINEEALVDGYAFSESAQYSSPKETTLDGYKSIIDALPNFEKPEVFGMNENANITFKLSESKQALQTILSVQPREQNSGGNKEGVVVKSQDQVVDEMCDILMAKLPNQIKKMELEDEKGVKIEKIKVNKNAGLDIDSLRVCVSQEVFRFNRLLSAVQVSLINLKKAIKGEVVMTQELDSMYQSLLNNQVPTLWSSKAYLTLKPLASFYDDLMQRVLFFQNWFNLDGGQAPNCYWISAFFFPQGFLTSVLQTYARKNLIPIDVLAFSFKFLGVHEPEQIHSSPETGAFIYGLYLEGCRFELSKMVLEDSLPGVTISQSPIVHFIPTEDYKPENTLYSMPVYKTNVRAGTLSTTGHSTNFIISIEVPTKKSPDYWVLNGAAFVSQQNE